MALDLTGRWTLTDETAAHTVPFDLPGDAITALHRAGVLPDPYWGRNEYDCRWISERDWTATRRFDWPGGPAELVIEELDCVAEITLNGQTVLHAANAFRRWRVDATAALRAGENEITITFRSPVREGAKRQAAQPFFVPYAAQNCPIPHGNMLRKPACDFGWDWNIALAPFGLYGAIRLEAPAPRIHDIVVTQVHEPGRAHVTLAIHADGTEATATLCGTTATAPIRHGVARLTLTIDTPDLWWPAGLGPQTLHQLTVTAGPATATRRIGLRELMLCSEPDAAGRSFGIEVNGHPTFARGANWIPADALAGRITREATRDLLQSAVDANMNMIRVWGGGRYEPTWFYDLCDELGLMVWQDFMFACNLYSCTPDFLAEVAEEVRDVTRRINHHACLAVWCGDNELIGALTWFPESRKDRDRYLVAYDRLNRTVESALAEVLPGANWWPSSPSPGPLAFGDAWHDDSSGDMHFWSVWHEGRDFDHYRDVKPRFCSEFGFQSYPSMEVIRRFAAPEDFNIAAPVMESHQKNAGGNARIAETMFRYFRFPNSFENFVYLSQIQQGLAIKTAVTQWRSLKPHCQGTLYWQLNDTWPVCSWSSLDHGGGWKLMHYMAKHFFQPLHVSAVPVNGTIELRAINDIRAPVRIEVDLYAITMSGGIRSLGTHTAEPGPTAALTVTTLPPGTLAEQEILSFTWREPGGPVMGDIFAPKPWKAYDLHPAGITLTTRRNGDRHDLTLASAGLGLFVAVEADCPGRFSDNAFTLFPGYPATLTFTPADPSATPSFTIRDLASATAA